MHSPNYSERMSNVAAVKGLKASVVILFDMGSSDWAGNPKVEYVGASRARMKVLFLLLPSNLPSKSGHWLQRSFGLRGPLG